MVKEVHWPAWREDLYWSLPGCSNSSDFEFTATACTAHLSLETTSLNLLICAAVAAVLYLLFEGGPCHWTRLAEAYYLIFVLTATAAAFVIAPNKNLDGRAHVAFYINRFMALLVVMKVYVSVINPTPMKPFYAQGDDRTFTRARPHSDESLAQRVLQQLEVYTTRLSEKREAGIFHRQVFSILLLPLLYIQLETMNYFDVAWVIFEPIRVAWVAFLSYSLIREIPRILYRKRTLNKVKNLLTYVLHKCDRGEMREVYLRANLANIFQATRYEVHELLVESALSRGLLDVWSKAMLINGMQKYGINGYRNEYVKDLILSCRNVELTELKSILDSTGDYNCLFKLIYNDIRSSSVREEVLYHLARESAAARRVKRGAVGVKVVSDIDDTLLCSGARFPAGSDDRIPRHMIYPGSLQLFKELDRSWTPEDPCCNLAFLSARPHIYKDISESKSFSKFKELFSTGRLHCVPTLLPGSLSLGLWAVVKALFISAHGWRDVGERKAKMFEQYKALYGEYDFIFFGDNGQGDLLAGQLLAGEQARKTRTFESEEPEDDTSSEEAPARSWCCWRRKPRPSVYVWRMGQGPKLKAVMIHEVLPESDCLSLEPVEERVRNWRQQLELRRICLFSSYPDAALRLHRMHPELVSVQQLRRVAEAAINDFDHDRKLLAEWEDWGAMEAVLSQDISSVGAVLEAAGEPLELRFKEYQELFVEDALNMNRRRLVLRGIHRRCHAHQLVDCGEELTSPEDSELSDSSHSEPIEGGERMNWVRAATTMGFDPSSPKLAFMKRIGSAWKELQAMNHNEAL